MTGWFVVGWIVIVAYVVFGNYLYFAKVLPVLRTAGLDEGPRMLPSAHLAQFHRAAAVLRGRGEHPWFLPLVSRCDGITYGTVGLLLLLVVLGVLT